MSQYTPLVVVILMFLAWLLRRISPAGGFLHTKLGATVIAGVSGLLGAVAQAIQAHGLSKATVIPAVTSFLMSLIATSNPSMAAQLDASENTPAETPAARTKQAGFIRLTMLLVIASIGVSIAFLGCKTTFGKAYSACLGTHVADLPATATKIPDQVVSILDTAATEGDTAAALEGLVDAYQDGGFLVACAVTAWKVAHPLPAIDGGAPAAPDGGSGSPSLVAAHKAANIFLSKHPAAAKRAANCAASVTL
jgi:hypothetical protein